MLEYREFPTRTAGYFLLFAPVFAYFIFIIKELIFGNLPVIGTNLNIYYLGVAGGSAALALLFNSVVIDRISRIEHLLALAGLTTPIIALLGYFTGLPGGFNPSFAEAWIIATFVCLAFFLLCWVLFLNRTVVVRFRGKISGLFILLSMLFVVVYTLIIDGLFQLGTVSRYLPEIITLIALVCTLPFKSWRWRKYPLAVHGNHMKYFVPMVLLLACHMLWFFGTKVDFYNVTGSYLQLSQEFQFDTGFAFATYEPLLLGFGALLAGAYADFRGRKTAFNMAILLMGLLAIFSPTLYSPQDILAVPLLVGERLVEGYIIGIGTLLIWNELGSAKTKARRLALIWFFFLGYALLFWAFDNNFLFQMETALDGWVGQFGGPLAILVALITLYTTTGTPEILGREVEMEELALDFDDQEVKETVDAFVGEEDFSSIRSQLEIMDVAQELSDSEFDEIMGSDFQTVLPLRGIPGIGPKLEAKLIDAGYKSAAQLAGETASRLASKVDGLSPDRAEKILSNARKAVKATIKDQKTK